jgi:hypothetical protein
MAKRKENNQAKHMAPGSDYLLSLSSIVGKPVKDLYGHISNGFGTPVFDVSRVVFEDGTEIYLEGEHDIAYISANEKVPGLNEEYLETLFDPDDEDDDEDD